MNEPFEYISLLKSDGVIVLEGVAGIGKTHAIEAVRHALQRPTAAELCAALTSLITEIAGKPTGSNLVEELSKRELAANSVTLTILAMHPSTSYEEMIGGLRPVIKKLSPPDTGTVQQFEWTPGKLLRAIQHAMKDVIDGPACRRHLIVLDEINRCNLPSVLGELMFLIEPGRRISPQHWEKALAAAANDASNAKQLLMDQCKAIRLGLPEGADEAYDVFIPTNLFLLGTMNSSDRSILGFDQALRRRFPPCRQEPMTIDRLRAELGTIRPELDRAIHAWACLNTLLRWIIGPDAMIGHSYWFGALERHGGDPNQAWRFGVLPQAIHAAESARKERFLADVFRAPPEDFTATYIGEDDTHELEKAWAACCPEKQPALKVILAACRSGNAEVILAGSGHGEKLLIRPKDGPAWGSVPNSIAGTNSALNESRKQAIDSPEILTAQS